MISVSFIVKSSSLVPDFKSLTTEGLIHSGGTKSRVRIKSEGLPASGFIRSRGISSTGILLKRFNTTNGFKFSYKIHQKMSRLSHQVTTFNPSFLPSFTDYSDYLLQFLIVSYTWYVFSVSIFPHFNLYVLPCTYFCYFFEAVFHSSLSK